MPTIIHSAIVVPRCRGKVLLLKRRPDDRSFRGWCFPGGQRDGEEDPAQTASREFREETGYPKPEGMGYLGHYKTPLPERDRLYEIDAYVVDVEGEPTLSDEHEEARWVTPMEGLALPLAGPTTRKLLEAI